MTKHKYADVIIAWANGETIQCKLAGIDGAWDKWEDYTSKNPDFCSGDWEWRVKPKYEWDSSTTVTIKLETIEKAALLCAYLNSSNNEAVYAIKSNWELSREEALAVVASVSYPLWCDIKHLDYKVDAVMKDKIKEGVYKDE